MLQALQVLSLLLVAIAMAFALAHAAELPGKRRLDRDSYLAMQTVYYPGFTVGGVSEPASIVCLAALLLFTPQGSAGFGWTCAALVAMIGMQAVYWPVTHRLDRLWLGGEALSGPVPAEYEFADWVRLRNRWEYSHVLRACFGIFALLSLGIAVTARANGIE
jgi:hypothetical protein